MTTDRIIDVPGNDMPPEPTMTMPSDYLPVSSVSRVGEGYRCDGASSCYTWARMMIHYKDIHGVLHTRRYCDLHAAWRLGVRP